MTVTELRDQYTERSTDADGRKRLAVFRMGGFGDQLMAASCLPWLKSQGWHISFWCSRRHSRAVCHDPNIDTFIPVDMAQLSEVQLAELILAAVREYDAVLNLSDTCEGAVLQVPERASYYWPVETRRAVFGQLSYLNLIALLAGCRQDQLMERFYPTDAEMAWARKQRACGGQHLLVSCSGSGVHKWYPHLSQVLSHALRVMPDLHIWTVGEASMFKPFARHERLYQVQSEWTLRQSMTFATQADIVMGPETGLLHAAGHLPNAKVLLLSHSSAANIGNDWINCQTVSPDPIKAWCHPCHRMHRVADFCEVQPSGAALCAESIKPMDVVRAINRAYRQEEILCA